MCALAVTGEDALSFLQGQFSQELRAGRSPEVNYGFWLNQKGKVIGDAVVMRESEERCRILSWSMSAPALIARLEAYLIADDVTLTDETGRWSGWQLAGAGAEAWAIRWQEEQRAAGLAGWMGREPAPGAAVWVVAEAAPAWPTDWTAGAAVEFERGRIAAGLARVPADLGDEDLPQEAGLVAAGVSFTKGCYLGQEVMARVQARGRVRRRLLRVGGEGPAPVDGAGPVELWQGEKRIGVLRSRIHLLDTGWIGLAMMSLGAWQAEHPVQLGGAGGAAVWVAAPAEAEAKV